MAKTSPNVIDFPGHNECPRCGARLRPATWDEVMADRASADPQISQLGTLSTQGRRDVPIPADLDDPAEPLAVSWQYRCDKCGNRSVFAKGVSADVGYGEGN